MSPVRRGQAASTAAAAAMTTTPDAVYVFQHPLSVLRHNKSKLSMPSSRVVRSWALTAALIAFLLVAFLGRLNNNPNSNISTKEETARIDTPQEDDDRPGEQDTGSESQTRTPNRIAQKSMDDDVLSRLGRMEQVMARLSESIDAQHEEDARRRLSSSLLVDKEVKSIHADISRVGDRVRALEKQFSVLQGSVSNLVTEQVLKQHQDLHWRSMSEFIESRLSSHQASTTSKGNSDSATNAVELRREIEEYLEKRLGSFTKDKTHELNLLRDTVTSVQARLDEKCQGRSFEAEDGDRIVQLAVNKSLETFREDGGVARADFALVSGGASVIRSLTSPTFWGGSESDHSLLTRLFKSTAVTKRPPEEALSSTVDLGSCWPCKLGDCRLAVRLSARIRVTSVTLEHIAESLLVRPAKDGDSAPRDFEVFALDDDDGRKIPLGAFRYVRGHPLVQTFSVSRPTVAQAVLLEVKSNYGHPDAVCIYRFRVHGEFV